MVIVKSKFGIIEGNQERDYQSFLGIPYAKPPIGDRRFKGPQPLDKWDGIKDATKFGPIAFQGYEDTIPLNHEESEDCLYLNIWTPSADDKKRPVMVWVHGGGFVIGGSTRDRINGARLTSYGDVVIVNFNYRLGVLGFLDLPAVTPNIGILDQITALKWVRENIKVFGGDPDNITIFGESSGGESVAILLSIPESRDLMNKAIIESGVANPITFSGENSRKGANELLEKLRIKEGIIQALQEVPIKKLIRIQKKISGTIFDDKINPFRPFIDGEVIPEQPIELIRQGKAAKIPIILGWNEDEIGIVFPFFKQATDEAKKSLINIFKSILNHHGVNEEKFKQLRKTYDSMGLNPQISEFKFWSTILSDSMFRIPTIRQMEAHLINQTNIYNYIFSYESLVSGTAFHTFEIPFVFGQITLDEYNESLRRDENSEKLSKMMMDTWLSFAKTGNPNHEGLPNWPFYDKNKRNTMILGISPKLKQDPMSETRKAWNEIF